MNTDSRRGGKGLSTRHLIMVFLAGVAVCGVFFSLGFLVGYNERSGRMSPATERVTTSGAIPPTVNSPLETVPIGTNDRTRSASSVPSSLTNPSRGSTPSSSSQQKLETTARVEPPVISPPPLSAKVGAEPAPAATSSVEARAAGGGFIVQVTAMRAKQDAESVVRVLRGRGYHALLVAAPTCTCERQPVPRSGRPVCLPGKRGKDAGEAQSTKGSSLSSATDDVPKFAKIEIRKSKFEMKIEIGKLKLENRPAHVCHSERSEESLQSQARPACNCRDPSLGLEMTPLLRGRRGRGGECQRGTDHPIPP